MGYRNTLIELSPDRGARWLSNHRTDVVALARARYATTSALAYTVNVGAFSLLRIFAQTPALTTSVACAAAEAALLASGDRLMRRAGVSPRRRVLAALFGMCGCLVMFWALAVHGSSLLLAQAAAALVGGGCCWTVYRPGLNGS
jgi:hypothetical protein